MTRTIGLIFIVALFAFTSLSQTGPAPKAGDGDKAVSAARTPLDTAKATLAAHGGEKLKAMKSMLTKGSVDLSVFGQQMPGAFSTAISGEKYYFEINATMQSLKQVYDGVQTSSSLQGFSLPPVNRLGFPVLGRIGDEGYIVTALPETAKKKKGFRLTTPEGWYTDFYIDEKTSQIKAYDSSFESSGRVITTSVEIDEFLTVDGIVAPKKYSQRFDLGGQMTTYANFKAKDILINTKIDADAFVIK